MTTLREALQAIKDELPNKDKWLLDNYGSAGVCEFPVRDHGICGNVDIYFYNANEDDELALRELNNLLIEYMRESTGATVTPGSLCQLYPVGGKDEYVEESDDGTLWDNPKRLALLDWLLENCK